MSVPLTVDSSNIIGPKPSETPGMDPLIAPSDSKIFRIDTIAAKVWYFLAGGLAAATALCITGVVLTPNPLTITILVITAVALAIFAFAEGMDRIKPYLSPKNQLIANFVQSVAQDILTLIATTILTPFEIFKYYFQDPDNKERPVLYIHGWRSNPGTGAYFHHHWKAAGLGSFHAIHLENNPEFNTKHYVKLVKAKIKEINRPDLILVGHSWGGIIAMNCAKKVAAVITLASPLEGTTCADKEEGYRIFGKLINWSDKRVIDMHPASAVIAKLKEKVSRITTPTLHVASQTDPVIQPWESALFHSNKGSHVQRAVIEKLGHTAFYFSDKVMGLVLNFVKQL